MLLRLLLILISASFAFAQSSESAFAERNARYRLQPGDVIEVHYRYTPEFNQSASIQPDGFVSLNLVGGLQLGGLTLDAAKQRILEKSSTRLRDPEISLLLKEYVKPHFVVAGEVAQPGRFELRGPVSALEAVAMAGGLKNTAKHSQAILYRKVNPETAETKIVNLKQLATLNGKKEDVDLRPGDLLYVPQSRISKIERYVKWGSFGIYANPMIR
jgi:polysaccharide export outer membrane protein